MSSEEFRKPAPKAAPKPAAKAAPKAAEKPAVVPEPVAPKADEATVEETDARASYLKMWPLG